MRCSFETASKPALAVHVAKRKTERQVLIALPLDPAEAIPLAANEALQRPSPDVAEVLDGRLVDQRQQPGPEHVLTGEGQALPELDCPPIGIAIAVGSPPQIAMPRLGHLIERYATQQLIEPTGLNKVEQGCGVRVIVGHVNTFPRPTLRPASARHPSG